MGLEDFLQVNRLKNLFGGGGDEPSPFKNVSFGNNDESESEILPSRQTVPNYFGDEPEQDDEVSALDQFRESVLNPPQRDRLGSKTNILRMLGTGTLSGLQGTEEGQRKPVYNAAGKVIGSKPKGFWESFGEKPFNVEQASEIMNLPHEQRLADWKLRTGGLSEAARIEQQGLGKEELARLRASQIPREERLGREGETRLDQGQQRIDILKDKENKNTLTDREKVELQGYIRSGQINQQGNIRSGQITQQGDIRSRQIGEQGDIRSRQIGETGDERLEQIGAQGDIRSRQIGEQGEQQRQTKVVIPGKAPTTLGDKPESATQTKTRLQLKANEGLQAHPEWSEFMSINPNTGMVDIVPPSSTWYGGQSGPDKKTYDEMVLHMKGGQKTAVEEKTDKTAPLTIPPKKTGSVVEPPDSGKILTKTQRNPATGATRVVTSSDGGKTWSVKK